MKRKQTSDGLLFARAIRPEAKWTAADFIYKWLTSLLLTLGICGAVYATMSGCTANIAAVVLTAALFSAIPTAAQRTKYAAFGIPAALLIFIVVGAATLSAARDGTCGLINAYADKITMETGRIFLRLETAQDTAGTQTLAAAMLAGALALLLGMMSNVGKAWLLLIPAALLTAGIACGFLTLSWAIVLFIAGAALYLIRAAQYRGDAVPSGHTLFGAMAAVLLPAVLVMLLGGLLSGRVNADQNTATVRRALHALRYDSQSNSMPEGRLSDLKPWTPSEKTALKITMEIPQKLYLRGFIGEVYTGTDWQQQSGETLLEAGDTFYWLHQNGFYGQTQIAEASTLTGETKNLSMTVENVSACRRWAYLPYALSDNTMLDALRIGDAGTYAQSQTGSFSYLAGSVPEWYLVQAQIAGQQDTKDADTAAYLQDEQAYNEYALKNDLSIPEAVLTVFNERLGAENTSMTLTEVKSAVLKFLDENLQYDENVTTASGARDFAAYTLERTARGYSVHYATIATLLFRYYGVPARYVEGYFLPADEAQAYADGEEIQLDETHAHAWVEYYLDGMGWLPFEVTPGYIDDEEVVLSNLLNDENSPLVQYAEKTYTQDHTKDNIQKPRIIQPESEETKPERWKFLHFNGSMLLVVLLVIVILLTLLICTRRRRFRNAMADMAAADNRDAAAMLFGYAVSLMSCCGLDLKPVHSASGLSTAISQWYEGNVEPDIFTLNDEAMFSNHTLSDADRDKMQRFSQETLQRCMEKWSLWKRLYYKWIHCIY